MIQYYVNVKKECLRYENIYRGIKKTIIELYENGNKNKSELAREYGISERNVSAWIKKYGSCYKC